MLASPAKTRKLEDCINPNDDCECDDDCNIPVATSVDFKARQTVGKCNGQSMCSLCLVKSLDFSGEAKKCVMGCVSKPKSILSPALAKKVKFQNCKIDETSGSEKESSDSSFSTGLQEASSDDTFSVEQAAKAIDELREDKSADFASTCSSDSGKNYKSDSTHSNLPALESRIQDSSDSEPDFDDDIPPLEHNCNKCDCESDKTDDEMPPLEDPEPVCQGAFDDPFVIVD